MSVQSRSAFPDALILPPRYLLLSRNVRSFYRHSLSIQELGAASCPLLTLTPRATACLCVEGCFTDSLRPLSLSVWPVTLPQTHTASLVYLSRPPPLRLRCQVQTKYSQV